jgi:D-glycero-alpha-D-manno-heptose 1-phosphate guanylyltransferase
MITRLQADALDGVIVGVPVTDASRFGTIEANADAILRSFREKKCGAGLVNGGLYLFPRSVLERFLPVRPMSIERDIVPQLLRDRARIGVIAIDAPFLDIGVPVALAAAEAFVTAHFGDGAARDAIHGDGGMEGPPMNRVASRAGPASHRHESIGRRARSV